MRCFWTTVIVFLSFIVLAQSPISAQNSASPAVNCTTQRCGDCDVCGYCRLSRTADPGKPTPVQVPGNWQQCRQCLYPDFPGIPATQQLDAKLNLTLQINNDSASPFYNTQITPRPGRYYTQAGCVLTDIGDFTSRENQGNAISFILRGILNVSGGIAFLYLIYGAYTIMTAQGDPVRLNQGRSTIFGAIFGLIFVLLSTFILNLIATGILKIPGFGG